MSDIVVAFAVVTVLSGGPLPRDAAREELRPISTAVAETVFPAATAERARARLARPSSSRDSLKNGALLGAVIGAALGGVVSAVGCGLSNMFSEESRCGGQTIAGAAGGAGLGAHIGGGIDALLDDAQHPMTGGGDRRTIVRLHVKFRGSAEARWTRPRRAPSATRGHRPAAAGATLQAAVPWGVGAFGPQRPAERDVHRRHQLRP